MKNISTLSRELASLVTLSTNVEEDIFRIEISGNEFTASIELQINKIVSICDNLTIFPSFTSTGETIELDDIRAGNSHLSYSGKWIFRVGKSKLSDALKIRGVENTIVFFDQSRFVNWSEKVDPFNSTSDPSIDFNKPLTIRVHGLKSSFGGSRLWVLDFNSPAPPEVVSNLPSSDSIQKIIHTVGYHNVSLPLENFSITWGAVECDEARAIRKISGCILASCLAQEIEKTPTGVTILLRGAKRISLYINHEESSISSEILELLHQSITWVYEERAETRHQLIMERLSIEAKDKENFIDLLTTHLASALAQAKDSYGFVITERKDAYHKELRELMKDMRIQADMYASKVRDLTNTLTRDILGMLLLFGVSFISKFDKTNISTLLKSSELSLFTKFLACYFIISCILQIIAHERDSKLSYDEIKKWTSILKNYTSNKDNLNIYFLPIDKRRTTLVVAMCASGALYFLLAFTTWNLPFIIELLLAQNN